MEHEMSRLALHLCGADFEHLLQVAGYADKADRSQFWTLIGIGMNHYGDALMAQSDDIGRIPTNNYKFVVKLDKGGEPIEPKSHQIRNPMVYRENSLYSPSTPIPPKAENPKRKTKRKSNGKKTND